MVLGNTALMKVGLRSSAGTMMRWQASATSERFVDLLVELDRRALVAGRHAAIDPCIGAVQPLAQADQLRGVEDIGNADQHDRPAASVTCGS